MTDAVMNARQLRRDLARLDSLAAPAKINQWREQQFWFDSLIKSGTFTSGTVGWATIGSPTVSTASNTLSLTSTAAENTGAGAQMLGVTPLRQYQIGYDVVAETGNGLHYIREYSSAGIGTGADRVSIGSPTVGNGQSFHFRPLYEDSFMNFFTTNAGGQAFELDNVFLFESDGTDIIHRLPEGWLPADVLVDGLLIREGATHDYTVETDSFDTWIKPAVAPGALTETCIKAVRKVQ